MKKFFILILPITFLVFSCRKSNQEALNKLADEMCAAMEFYDEDDPLSILKVDTVITELALNANEYKDITQDQLEAAMETICPEGFVKFKTIISAE